VIPKEARRFEIYTPLHRLWLGYVTEILGLRAGQSAYVTAQSAGPVLASADFHGALVRVVRCRCVGRVGCEGIVVKDTKFTFEVITRGNKLKMIPKRHTIFRIEIPQPVAEGEVGETEETEAQIGGLVAGEAKPCNLVFELHGSQLENRATDRATKKFKQRRMDDL